MSEDKEKLNLERLRKLQRSNKWNKRCADCVEIGTTYVCTTFNTFICTACSGIHREFNHKVKGISVSKWSTEEIENIEKYGGNDRARGKYMALWKDEEDTEPQPAQTTKVRNFIRQKYIDKKWMIQSDDSSKNENLNSNSNEINKNKQCITSNCEKKERSSSLESSFQKKKQKENGKDQTKKKQKSKKNKKHSKEKSSEEEESNEILKKSGVKEKNSAKKGTENEFHESIDFADFTSASPFSSSSVTSSSLFTSFVSSDSTSSQATTQNNVYVSSTNNSNSINLFPSISSSELPDELFSDFSNLYTNMTSTPHTTQKGSFQRYIGDPFADIDGGTLNASQNFSTKNPYMISSHSSSSTSSTCLFSSLSPCNKNFNNNNNSSIDYKSNMNLLNNYCSIYNNVMSNSNNPYTNNNNNFFNNNCTTTNIYNHIAITGHNNNVHNSIYNNMNSNMQNKSIGANFSQNHLISSQQSHNNNTPFAELVTEFSSKMSNNANFNSIKMNHKSGAAKMTTLDFF